MGIWIYCDEKEYSCSYGFWNKFRMATINATFKYIKSYISLTEITEYEKVYADKLLEFINKIESESNFDIDIFLNYCKESPFIDTLVFFNISGLYAFCNKSDCEGYYSVGNSYDICQLFKLIKKFYIVDKEFFKNIHKTINKIKKIFQESIKKRKIITIS
jgi:hypothetical protein